MGNISLNSANKRLVLDSFSRATRRERHVLTVRPELTWEQLYNRLQWETQPVPIALLGENLRRRAPGTPPWLHWRTRVPESDSLVATLRGHTKSVLRCAIAPDGRWIVSTSGDNTLKIWDAVSGAERATLRGHTGPVWACAIAPDGTWVVSASGDGTLKIWDASSGSERATLSGHTGEVTACAIAPDGEWLVSASRDCRWTPKSGLSWTG